MPNELTNPPSSWLSGLFNGPQSWMWFVYVFGVAALLVGVWILYRREIDTAPRAVKIGLALVRCLVIIVLAIVLLGPSTVTYRRQTVQPYLVLLLDDSASMGMPDKYTDDDAVAHVTAALGRDAAQVRQMSPTRTDVIHAVFEKDDGKVLRELAQHARIRVMTFSSRVQELKSMGGPAEGETTPGNATPSSRPAPAPSMAGTTQPSDDSTAPQSAVSDAAAQGKLPAYRAEGQSTNISKAIREALRTLQGNPVAGIVLVSDGGVNDPPGDDPAAAAEAAAQANVPLFVVGVGDTSKQRNIRVADATPSGESVWRGDPFTMEAQVYQQGYDGEKIKVDLVEKLIETATTTQPASMVGVERIVGTQTADFTNGKTVDRVLFTHKPDATGRYVYTVRAEPRPNEFNLTDNEKSAKVKVISEQARVLLVAGAPSWEYQLVRNLLIREKTMKVFCWLQSMDADVPQDRSLGEEPLKKLPETGAQLDQYDVVLLFDPNPTPAYNPIEMSSEWITALTEFVDKGGGVFYMAGPQFSSRFLSLPQTEGIRKILPVSFDSLDALDVDALSPGQYTKEWKVIVTPDGLTHAMLRLDADPRMNQDKWAMLPGIYWSFPARGLVPTAQSLLEHSDPALRNGNGNRVLLATSQWGSGRTAYMGFDGSWRWRSLGKDSEYFDKFWVQSVRYLIEGRRLSGGRRGKISSKSDVYYAGDKVSLTATFSDRNLHDPLSQPVVPAVLQIGKNPPTEFEFHAKPDKPGEYTATLTVTQVGEGEVSVQLPGEREGQRDRIALPITVAVPQLEMNDPRLNTALLHDLAGRTHSVGGEYFDVDQVSTLPKAIPDRSDVIIIRDKPKESWDSKWLLVGLVALLSMEWAVRKYFKLL